MNIVNKYKLWFSLSLVVIIIGLVMFIYRGVNIGIDFVGGTTISIDMGKDFTKSEVDEILSKYSNEATSKKVNDTQLEIRSKEFTAEKVSEFFSEIKEKYSLEDSALLSQTEIGESVGKELTTRALIALVIATICMLIYIVVRFEVYFGIAAIIALIHDVLITLSAYAIFFVPINSPFIAAILTIVGYSINDTIVIFDRIRENKKLHSSKSNEEIANLSLKQSYVRCINTSITTIVVILSVYIFVPSIREFSFPILIGMISGTYSSLFIATPIWILLTKKRSKEVTVNR